MQFLNTIDYAIIGTYCLILMGIGIVLQRKASASVEDYFLGGRKMPWWLLGVSGTASFLDMTGTMLIVSFLYMLGPRGLFVEFRGGAVLVLAFMMLWTGKWHRRSGCITQAHWNIFRFGSGIDGQLARVVQVVATMVMTIGMLTYLIKGAGLFLTMFLPFGPRDCALIMVGVATLYTITSGFYGVVWTDLLQSGVIIIAVVFISWMAISSISSHGDLDALAWEVVHSPRWTSSTPHWNAAMPKGYEQYSALFLFATFYLFRNMIGGVGSGGDPKYFGARNERECGLLTFLWTTLMTLRWPMMMGFAVLGLFLVKDFFPDQSVLPKSEQAIKRYLVHQADPDALLDFDREDAVERIVPKADWGDSSQAVLSGPDGGSIREKLAAAVGPEWESVFAAAIAQDEMVRGIVPKSDWDDAIAAIYNHPETHPALVDELRGMLGDDWQTRLRLLSYEGTINPEKILPGVILFDIPKGMRGLLLIALIAAAMSTFDSQVNTAIGFFTVDVYRVFVRPRASNRELMLASYTCGLVIIAAGFMMAYYVENINDIWGWIVMGLGGALSIPSVLRLYWWRFNAWGVVGGTVLGLTAALVQRLFKSDMHEWAQFGLMTGVSLAGSLIGTYLAPPTDRGVLEHFYRVTRPFGLWGPLKAALSPDEQAATSREHFYDIAALPFALGWQVSMFLLPMQAVIGSWTSFMVTLPVFLFCLLALYFLWYRHLPPATEMAEPVSPARAAEMG